MVEYRGAFLTGALAQTISYGTTFILIWIMVNKFKTLNGWQAYEILFLYAYDLCSYALAAFFTFNLSSILPVMIQTGEFDDILTKPLNPFIHIVSREFNIGYFSHISLSIFVFILCFIKLSIKLTFIK
ncbi:MAG: ABC-2 family transporter protein, partial [Candidatus Pacearchaeota archaeon]|nr:ABC-2 family transporter protein [Candidatus Pacearchaeota archaeon]